MDNQALQQIKDIIDQFTDVSVIVGRNARIDEMAGALSLYLTFQHAGKKATVASVTQPLVEHSSLVGIDKVANTLQTSGGDFIVSFPYQEEGEIEKVSYTLENGQLNIIVKPSEQGLSFSEKDVKYRHGGGVGGLVITVGVPRLSDITSLVSQEGLKDTTIINIDNKEQNENYGNVVLVSPRFSSVSEQVADLLLSLGYDFDIDTAQNLLYGISAATNNFQSANTSYLAFEIAAILLRKGAKRPERQAIQPHQQQPRHGGQGGQQQNQQRQQGNQPNQQRFSGQPRQQGQTGGQRPQQQHVNPSSQRSEQHRPQPQQQMQQPVQQPVAVSQPISQPVVEPAQEDLNPPADWLTPKVYKGSTNI